MSVPRLTIRPANERGHAQIDWLDSWHTFSFADYHDPAHVHFRSLRVINDDRIAAASGFGMHPHRDMEIISYVIEGRLQHRDSMGNGSVIGAGDVQTMTAGSGVQHSEFNPSDSAACRLLQIWILPDAKGHRPSYGQASFPRTERINRLVRAVSGSALPGADTASALSSETTLPIHQDASLYLAALENGEVTYELRPGRHAWIQVASGTVTVNGIPLSEGDGASTSDPGLLQIASTTAAEVLLFDLG